MIIFIIDSPVIYFVSSLFFLYSWFILSVFLITKFPAGDIKALLNSVLYLKNVRKSQSLKNAFHAQILCYC